MGRVSSLSSLTLTKKQRDHKMCVNFFVLDGWENRFFAERSTAPPAATVAVVPAAGCTIVLSIQVGPKGQLIQPLAFSSR